MNNSQVVVLNESLCHPKSWSLVMKLTAMQMKRIEGDLVNYEPWPWAHGQLLTGSEGRCLEIRLLWS